MGRIEQFLSTNGDGTGTIEMSDDFSNASGATGKTRFYIQPPEDEKYFLERMLVVIRDAQGISVEKYGAIAGGLTNGIRLDIRSQGKIVDDPLGGQTIQTNVDWARYSGVDVEDKTWGTGDDFISVRWTWGAGAGPVELDGRSAMRLTVTCEDDMSGLVSQTMFVQGTSDKTPHDRDVVTLGTTPVTIPSEPS